MSDMRPDFEISYGIGIVQCVCSCLELEEIKTRMAERHPGLEYKPDSRFHWEETPNGSVQPRQGSPCDQAPTTHKHYLFVLRRS